MKIEIQIGNAILRVGEPSANHLTIRSSDNDPPTIHIGEWKAMKATVDQMFASANILSNPPKLG